MFLLKISGLLYLLTYITDGVSSTPEPEEEKEETIVKVDESISDVKSIMMDMMNEPSQMFQDEVAIKDQEDETSQISEATASNKSNEDGSGGTKSSQSLPEPAGPWNYDENEDTRTYVKSGRFSLIVD